MSDLDQLLREVDVRSPLGPPIVEKLAKIIRLQREALTDCSRIVMDREYLNDAGWIRSSILASVGGARLAAEVIARGDA